MKRTIYLFVATVLATSSMSNSSYAAANCWSTWDPFACFLQEWFGNGNTQLERITLPDPESDGYQTALTHMKDAGFGLEEMSEYHGPETVEQTCKADEILDVALKTRSVKETALACFK